MDVIFTITLPEDQEPTTIFEADLISILAYYQNLTFSFAQGYMGSEVESISERISFLDLGELNRSVIDINEATIDIEISNGFGLDMSAIISDFTVFNSNNQTETTLDHEVVGTSINLARAQIQNGQIIPSVRVFNINSSNSNLNDVIEVLADSA